MAELLLACLGNFQVSLAEMALTAFQTDKTRALLAYLTVESQVHQRTELAQFLWPGYGEESARNSLRQSIHQLRQLLHDAEADPPWLLLTRQTAQINPAAHICVDVMTFTRLLAECRAHAHAALAACPPCLDRLRQAVDLYQGDFLAGLSVVDSDPFEEWRRITQEQLHIQMLGALTELAGAAESAGDEEGALWAAQRQLAMEPWFEPAHRQVMRILAKRGQPAAAIAQYQRCHRVLAEELGVPPDAETTALYEQIQKGSFDKVRGRGGGKATPPHPLTPTSASSVEPLAEVAEVSVEPSPAQHVTPTHNLPLFPTPLIGRAHALAEINTLMQRPGLRLLTLVGPGGMGKTRLAVEVGRERLGTFADGVFFVALAPISTPAALVPAIATALGIAIQGSNPRSVLFQTLHQKQLLLILDNFEHLLVERTAPGGAPEGHPPLGAPLGAVDLVVDLLGAAPGVQILVTSRERLKLHDEQLYPVQALTFSATATLAEATASAAVRLFVQSVRRVQTDFQLTATNLAAVLRICRLVQGMPLGLELAAANAVGAPLTAIAEAIEQSTEFLTVDSRDLPERQRSMRAVFGWSWRLLNAEEQRILRQSALFRGGFAYSAAQAVTGATLPLLTRLTEKSLLQWQATGVRGSPWDGRGEGRYAMHELLRQFAAEELTASGERAVVEERHGRYYLAYLAARGQRLGRGEPKEASSEIQAELDNVRLAWQWAVDQGCLAEIEQTTYAWWQFCQFQGLEFEGRQSFALAVEGVRRQLAQMLAGRGYQVRGSRLRDERGPEDADVLLGQRLLAKLLAIHANSLFAQGRDEEMAAQAHEAVALGAASGGVEGETFGTFVLGRVLQDLEQKREAQEMWRQTIQLVRRYQANHPENEFLHEAHWMAHNWLRGSALHFGDYIGSRSHMVQALQICQTLGKRWGELFCSATLAGIDFFLYDFAAAEAGFFAALDLARTLGYRRVEMLAQDGLAGVFRLRGDYTRARTLLEQAVSLAAEQAFPYDEALFLAALIRLHCQLGDHAAAAQRHEQLTQLLARVKLAKECQLYAYLAAAVRAHDAGATQEALRYAEQADEVNQQGGDILFRLVDTTLILGHVRAAAGQWKPAAAAFRQGLDAFLQSAGAGFPLAGRALALAAEPQAGLAQIALAQGDLAGAKAQVEAILPVLAEEPHAGYNNPFFIYLTCYRVLAANGERRAASLLQQGYALLHQDAAGLDDETRHHFLTTVPIHRALDEAYHAWQAQQVKVTNDKVTRWQGDKTTAPADAPITPSPDHLVTLSPFHDWGDMPAADLFHGRELERAELARWLGQPGCRLVVIHGIGGVGKTSLAASVIREIAAHFDFVIWRSLLNAPPLVEMMRDWLQLLGRHRLADLPDKQDDQMRLLLGYLRQQRGLLILDNLESVLQAGVQAGAPRPGYEGYAQLIQQVGSSDHHSCLLLTSREQPQVLVRLLGHTPAVRLLPLAGLDTAAGQELLQLHGLSTSAAEATSLVERYSGNPLALQLVASTISDLFGGNVVAFQQEGALAFDNIRQVLDEQVARLSHLEREILIWLAVEREVVTVPTLRSNLVQPGAPRLLVEALQALQKRSLLERSGEGFTLQNVVMEYVTELLVEQVCKELAHYGGVEEWEGEEASGQPPLVPLATRLADSFLNHHALLKAQAKEVVRQSQLRMIVQPVAERLMRQLDRQGVETVLRRVLAALRAQSSEPLPTAGYAAGNMLNLLLYLGSDVAGYNFSHLSVWQANLRGVYAPRIDFTGANLAGSAFTYSFGNLLTFQFDADNQLLVAELQDERLRIWRMADRAILSEWSTHGLNLRALFLSPDCQLLAGIASDYVIHLFDCASGRLLHTLAGHYSPIWRVRFSPEGRILASGDAGGHLCIWACQSGQLLQSLSIPDMSITALAIAPDGQRLASATVDGTIYLWSVAEGTLLHSWRGHAEEVAGLEFGLDGTLLASGSHDATVRLWEVPGGRLRHGLQGHIRSIRDMATTPAGRVLASGGGDPFVYLWDLEHGTALHILSSHASAVERLVISPDGKWMATLDLNAIVSLWDTLRGQRVDSYPIHRNTHTSLAFAPDGQRLVSGGYDSALYLWDLRSAPEAQVIARLHGHRQRVMTVAFHPDGQTIASGAIDCDIYLWDSHSARRRRTLSGHSASIICLSFNPLGTLLASSSDDSTVALWSVADGQRLRVLRGHTNGLKCCCFSPLPTNLGREQPQLLASGGLDNVLRLWDVESGELLHTLQGHTNSVTDCLFTRGGRHLLSAGYDQTVRLWDTGSGQLLATWPTANAVYLSLALHPNGRLVAAGGDDNLIRLLDFETGRVLGELAGHSRHVACVRFSPTGQILASTSGDDTIKLWDMCALDQGAARDRCLQTLQSPGPYTGMEITGVTGIGEAQKAALKALGAVETHI